MPMRMSCLLAAVLSIAASAQADDALVRDEKCGISVPLPENGWIVQDLSAHGVVCRVYSPKVGELPRVVLMRYPAAYLPEGMATRASHVERVPGNRRIHIKPRRLAGLDGQEYVWRNANSRAIEIGVLKDGYYTVVQVSAEFADWEDEAKATAFGRVFASVQFLDGSGPRLRVDAKSPVEVRGLLREQTHAKPRRFAIVSHDLLLEVDPEEHRLTVTDTFVVGGRSPKVEKVRLLCTHVPVKEISENGKPLGFSQSADGHLTISLASPMRGFEERTLRYRAECPEFRFSVDQELISEMAVLGQVEPLSSFSSHVYYYPVDETNDATVRMAISVPEGYTAVTGGRLIDVGSDRGRRVFRYEDPRRTPRLMPYGFAVARYESLSGHTAGGLELVVYFRKGYEKQARQRIAVLTESGNLFEKLMGTLPRKRVAFCQVKPFRKEAGCSLPGLVLFSDGFFEDIEGAEVTAELALGAGGGPLLFADELSHQWNAYAVPLPNVLAEGVSTFTDLLYIEVKAGPAEYRKALGICADAYLDAAEIEEDVAVADPNLYRSKVYREVSFCKTAVVLDLLRQQLGDEGFFSAWREAFTALRGGPAEFEDLERELGEAAKTDLRPFFDQWFFQAGYPRLKVTWRPEGSDRLRLEIEQTQPGGLFDLTVPVVLETAGGRQVRRVRVHEREQTVVLPVKSEVRSVSIDPERRHLLLRSRTSGS